MKQPNISDLFTDIGHDVPDAPKEPSQVVQELERLNAAALRVLAFLKLRGTQGALNWEIAQSDIGGIEGCRRVRELRAQGWNIDKQHVEKGSWRYICHGLRGQS
jgi:hypothetical protein